MMWEGSAMQEIAERLERERQERVFRIQRDNPSLTWADAEEWERQSRPKPPPPRCCACQSPARAEIVRSGAGLGPCSCECHKARPR